MAFNKRIAFFPISSLFLFLLLLQACASTALDPSSLQNIEMQAARQAIDSVLTQRGYAFQKKKSAQTEIWSSPWQNTALAKPSSSPQSSSLQTLQGIKKLRLTLKQGERWPEIRVHIEIAIPISSPEEQSFAWHHKWWKIDRDMRAQARSEEHLILKEILEDWKAQRKVLILHYRSSSHHGE